MWVDLAAVALDREHRLLLAEEVRSERLLLKVLTAPIAARLKAGEAVIADAFPDVTGIFADLVDCAGGGHPQRAVLGL